MNTNTSTQMETTAIDKSQSQSGANAYLLVPMLIFFSLLIFAVIRAPNLISSAGIGSAVIVVAPLILATYALTIIVMAGRAGVDLSIGPTIGFINVGMIQLYSVGFMESPIAFFLFAMGVGIAYQVIQALIIIFVRVQPIIVSLSGYLTLVGLNLIIMPRPGGVAPDWMFPWGSGTTIFSATLVILVLATVGWYIIARTAFFGHLRLMGSDERAAYTSGVRINMVRLGAHAIGGIYAGLAAITFTALISSGDPTQGTTYTLMAVTALVLGGANLAGGRGSAFGSLLGALNIYLITYVLSTFNFGMVQSFVTDMAYGVMLVVSLLISVAVPHLQKRSLNLSPLVFFFVFAVIALGVIMHTSMDQVAQPLVGLSGSSSYVILADGGIAKVSGDMAAVGYSTGTYILFIIIGIAAVVYGFRVLFKYPKPPMIAFMILMAIVALGLIFNPGPDTPADPAEIAEATTGLDAYTPAFFMMETIPEVDKAISATSLVSQTTTAIITISGVVLLASLIILVMLPQVTVRTKRMAMILFMAAVAVIAIGALFFDDFDRGYLTSNFSGEIYAIILVGVGLFTLTAPLVHNKFRHISNVFIALIGVLGIISVYFFTDPSAITNETASASANNHYAASIFKPIETAAVATPIEYAKPLRINVDTAGMASYTQLAYCAFIIVLLHVFLYIAMGESSFRSFWRLWPIPVFSALIWGSLFYATGVPLWKIVAVIAIAIISAPNVLHIISTYWIKQGRDSSISQWQDS
ncbi:MAG: ribose transport system permease protein [Parasphingorhabdus sp.]|jgi:ribose transport system permease protein